jgi:hypothetical protein
MIASYRPGLRYGVTMAQQASVFKIRRSLAERRHAEKSAKQLAGVIRGKVEAGMIGTRQTLDELNVIGRDLAHKYGVHADLLTYCVEKAALTLYGYGMVTR